MDEKQLIQGCKRKEPAAQKRFVHVYSKSLYAVCRRYMKDEMMAKDALQESLIQVLNNIDKYDEKGSFKGWVHTVTMRKNLEILRREKLRWMEDLPEIEANGAEPTIYKTLEKDEVMTFIYEMPHKYRVALIMFLVEGFSHKEIAEKLQISEGTSRSLVSRGRQMIKDTFNDANEPDYNTNVLTNRYYA